MRVTANDSGFAVDPDTDLLTALTRHDVCARYSCRNGNCGLCEAQLNIGSVWMNDSQAQVDAPARILLCRAFALGDISLTVPNTQQVLSRYCKVLAVERHGAWWRVELRLPAGRVPDLRSGHMLRLEDSVSSRCLTITALPTEAAPRVLEVWLNIKDVEWRSRLEAGAHVRIQLPLGESFAPVQGALRVLVDATGWDRAQALAVHLLAAGISDYAFVAIDQSEPPPWFSARQRVITIPDEPSSVQHIALVRLF